VVEKEGKTARLNTRQVARVSLLMGRSCTRRLFLLDGGLLQVPQAARFAMIYGAQWSPG
jgi:hypothetical protein